MSGSPSPQPSPRSCLAGRGSPKPRIEEQCPDAFFLTCPVLFPSPDSAAFVTSHHMASADNAGTGFKILAVDNVVYGPVELPVLVSWVRDDRVLPETWVFVERDDGWLKAGDVPELKMFYRGRAAAPSSPSDTAAVAGMVKPGALRRVKILADLTDTQLERFAGFMDPVPARQWAEVVRQNDHGDAMFLILEGELRVRMMISGKESILTTLGPGEFFGEVSLFDTGPRSADVIANKDSLLLKISAAAFQRLRNEAPELAAPFLYAVGKTLTARIRADNKRYKDSVNFARSATGA
jgi:hypothetical protein